MSSHWCYRCNRLVRIWRQDMVMCPDCDSGFLEEIEHPIRSIHVDSRLRRFPSAAAAMYMNSRHSHRHRHCRNNNIFRDHRSPFNPVIMLPGNGSSEGTSREGGENSQNTRRGFELFYDDGAGSGLRPLPPSMSEFLLGSGFDRVLENLSQIENNNFNGVERNDNNHHHYPPASKSAVDSLPTIEIDHSHLIMESHCAVCKEPFELGTTVKEMPCNHIYHSECILPWLAIRNSCPVCRHELPFDNDDQTRNNNNARATGEDHVGLTIWRLPGGGFAVGRFYGGRRGVNESDHELPVVYTEMDGAFNNVVVGEPRSISWTVSSSRGRESSSGGLRRMFGNLFGCFRGGVQVQRSNSITEYSVPMRRRRRSGSPSPRSRRTWSMDVNSGMRPW